MSATPEEFVTAWQKCNSIQEVAGALGMSYQAAYRRARDYRKRGVALKKMTSQPTKIDADELNRLCI